MKWQIEKLPDYPVDINNHQNQVVLKDFIARVIEELMEGYESTSEVVKICKKWGWNIEQLTEDEYTQVLNHLQNANEEQGDALGFLFTLFHFANILPEDIFVSCRASLTPGYKRYPHSTAHSSYTPIRGISNSGAIPSSGCTT